MTSRKKTRRREIVISGKLGGLTEEAVRDARTIANKCKASVWISRSIFILLSIQRIRVKIMHDD